MAVRIRLKKMGRTHRPFYRVCAIDRHTPRDGRVLEELGTYDTSVANTDARAILNNDRIDYWLSVGAQPSDKMTVLIKKYGSSGTHLEIQQQALRKLAEPKPIADPGPPASLPKEAQEAKAKEAAAPQTPTEQVARDKAAQDKAAQDKAAQDKAASAPEEASKSPKENSSD